MLRYELKKSMGNGNLGTSELTRTRTSKVCMCMKARDVSRDHQITLSRLSEIDSYEAVRVTLTDSVRVFHPRVA